MNCKMKYIIQVLAVIILFGCSDEDPFRSNGDISVTAGFTSTRTSFTEANGVTHVSWNTGDEIGLIGKEQANLKYMAQSAGKETSFKAAGSKLNAADGETVYAYYPYSESSESKDHIALPVMVWQNYTNDVTKLDFVYTTGKVADNKLALQFKHLLAFIKLTIPLDLIPDRGDNGGLLVQSSENISYASNSCFNLEKEEITNELYNYINYLIPEDITPGSAGEVTCYIAILPQSKEAVLKFHHQRKDGRGDCLLVKKAPAEGLKAGNVYTLSINENEVDIQRKQDRQALIDLYNATDGDNWTKNTNWCSDKPLDEWHGVSTMESGRVLMLRLDHNNLKGHLPASIGNLTALEYFDISWNNLQGEFPETLSVLMGQITVGNFHVQTNGFSGKLPKAIVEHARWKDYWPSFVCQNPDKGGGIDFKDVVIPAPSFTATDLSGNLIDSEAEYVKSKFTILCHWAAWCPYSQAFMGKLLNMYKGYHSKGLDIIGFNTICPYSEPCDKLEEMKQYIADNNIPWRNFAEQFIGGSFAESPNLIPAFWSYGGTPCVYVVDQNKNIVFQSLTEHYAKLSDFLAGQLGEIEPAGYYTSTDYSRDGEVVTLQKASKGKGINLVFMGEAFVDKDMGDGGLYEQRMNEAMEELFSIEPYKSFRNRFNAYAVKVISPNAEFAPDARHRLNGDDRICFDLALKAPVTEDRLMVSVVYNTIGSTGRSYTNMYEDGSFVGYMLEGVNEVLVHEVGGHGFAKLLDEYIEQGNEALTLPKEKKTYLDEVWNLDWGWGANVDYHGTTSTVKWAHLLADERYKDETGIYEGSYLYGFGAYRPTDNSMMRYNIPWFNAPSREAIYKAIMTLSEGAEWKYSFEEFATYDGINRVKTRSVLRDYSTQRQVGKQLPPTIIPGSWRDAKVKNTLVPLR